MVEPPDVPYDWEELLVSPTVRGFTLLPLNKDAQIKQLEQNLAEAKQHTAVALAEIERLQKLVKAMAAQKAEADLPFTERYD